ncbi:MAG: hypothetical protein KDD61_12580 [Bdellovibrionales bacterium]|nr:hypothetical protein [Bdellovibrionales bacterium]
MKALLIILLLSASSFYANASLENGLTAANPKPIEKIVSVTQVFMPEHFGTGENVYAVMSGLFPNGCYVYQRAELQKDPRENRYDIRNIALVHQGMCIAVLVPFNQQVKFGVLDPGTHHFRFHNGDGTYIDKSVIVQ